MKKGWPFHFGILVVTLLPLTTALICGFCVNELTLTKTKNTVLITVFSYIGKKLGKGKGTLF